MGKNMNKAFSNLQIKSLDEEQGIIKGIASTPTPDRVGDIVDAQGAVFKLPMPLLWQHKHDEPIGLVEEAQLTEKGIEITARISKGISTRIDEAWALIKSGVVKGLSIGYIPLEEVQIEKGVHYKKWEWFELSAVTIPCNKEASIQTVKHLNHSEGKTMTIQEKIESFKVKRKQLTDANIELISKSGDTLDTEQSKQYDDNKQEIASIDIHLSRLNEVEKSMIENATPVTNITTPEAATNARQGVVTTQSNITKGTAFSRYAIALARAKGNLPQAVEISKTWKDSTPEVETVLKAAVAAGTTTDATWAKPLVEYQNMTNEFIELLRPQTIMGKISGLRHVPFNIKIPGQTASAAVNWVGEGKPKPVSALAFNQIELGFAKCAGIVVITEELARFSNPAAEALISQDLRDGIAEFLDDAFIDPSKAEVAKVSPASITNGITAIASSGTDLDAIKVDVQKAFGQFIKANLNPQGSVWLMSATNALAISLMTNPLGQPEYPGINMDGGIFHGLPVVVSEKVGDMIILIKASDILLADDGGIVLDSSNQASLEMDDQPDGSGTLISLWQNNMIGIRAERFINWKRRRAEAVVIISGVKYGTVTD